MTEKHEYAATIRLKGCDNTGITEEIAKKMYATLERSTYAIVRLKHVRQINDTTAGRKVELIIEEIEPSQDDNLDEHLQQLMRSLHQNRVLTADDQQLQIDTASDVEPTVAQLVRSGQGLVDPEEDDGGDPDPDDPAFEPHDHVGPKEDSCLVCDQSADSAIHVYQDDPVEEDVPVPA